MESFPRLGVEGSNSIDQLATTVVGGRDGGSMAGKGVMKERLLQIIYTRYNFEKGVALQAPA